MFWGLTPSLKVQGSIPNSRSLLVGLQEQEAWSYLIINHMDLNSLYFHADSQIKVLASIGLGLGDSYFVLVPPSAV